MLLVKNTHHLLHMHKTTLLVRFFRLLRLLLHLSSGLLQSFVYPYFSQSIQKKMKQNWAKGFLKILSIKTRIHGNLPGHEKKRVLFAANHVSWLDICALLAICPSRFVAKSEIRNWPVIGLLCQNVGTLFVQRTKRSDTIRINQEIKDSLFSDNRVTIFPEGTTSDGTILRHFHASLLQSAVIADASLYPIAIRYRNTGGDICQEAAYIDPSLFVSLWKILGQARIDVDVMCLEPTNGHGKNRRELARYCESQIANALSLCIVNKEPEKFYGLPIE